MGHKSKIIAFNNNDKVHPPRYKLNEKDLEQVADSRHLRVTLPENLRFSKRREAQITKPKKPHLEYAAAAWNTGKKGK